MGDKSAIEWTDATWNPVTGCTKITRGCDHCYAERFAERFRGIPGHPYEQGFDVTLRPKRLLQPLAWKRPRMIFVNSMSDLFHKRVPPAFIDQVFDTMEAADWHIFQLLTKRSSRMRDYLCRRYGARPASQHIWCGVSVEDHMAAARVRHLQQTPIPTRFLSIEPLLGPIGDLDLTGIAWVIVGGESGPKARPMQREWAIEVRDRCEREEIPFFFKQWGGRTPKSGGRLLDDVEHSATPVSPKGRTSMKFRWHPDEPPPPLEEHSKAKLRVLRSYLCAYFDRLNIKPARDEFKLDLIDGFAGGGLLQDGDEIASGSPLIMLEESEAAIKRLCRGRTKPLHFDFKHYFLDANAAHIDCLRKVLKERDYQVDGEKIAIRNSRFEDAVDDIIAAIRRRQPRAGRSIFLLDQTGYSQVRASLVAKIFRELPRAEVILTFAADALTNFLAETPEFVRAVAPLELTESKIHELIQLKNGDGGKALVQRVLREHIRSVTRAAYDTPFFIRPGRSHRALWFLHLSRHPTARDVMIQRHWGISNTFEHYGSGGFDMLGWEALESKTLPLFHFGGLDAAAMHEQLLNSMPGELFSLASEVPITVDTMRHMLANRTAAPFSTLDEVLLQLVREREMDLLSPEGKVRSRALKRISPTDRIAFPRQYLLPGTSRRR